MRSNGTFRKKDNNFTIIGNTATRDKTLSLKAKGLYLVISSWITHPTKEITKESLKKECSEGAKAFDTAWRELKEKGYLKQYMQPYRNQKWIQEYELLDEPDMSGNHTHYLNAKGDVTKTNLTRKKITPEHNQRTTPKGVYAKGTYAKGIYAIGTYAEGGNKIINTKEVNTKEVNTKEVNTNLSLIPQDSLINIVRKEIDREEGIPYTYSNDAETMTIAIHYLTDWDVFHLNGYEDIAKQKAFNLAVEALIEMATESEVKLYNKRRVTYANVIDKINQSINDKDVKNIRCIIEQAVDDFIKATNKKEVPHPRNYIKPFILESFDTYEIKMSSLFNRTYYGGFN